MAKQATDIDEIIVNRMYIGSYLDQGKNIGHEVINLFQPDQGDKTYIWLNSQGYLRGGKNDRKNRVMLMVRYHHKDVWEVLAKTERLDLLEGTSSSMTAAERNNDQKKALDSLTYGGASIFEIMGKNKALSRHNKSNESEKDLIATFSTEGIYFPAPNTQIFLCNTKDKKKPFYVEVYKKGEAIDITTGNEKNAHSPIIDTEDNDSAEDPKQLSRESLRMFFTPKGAYQYGYDHLHSLLNSKFCWGEKSHGYKIEEVTHIIPAPLTFLSISGDEDRELAFSNILAHYLRNEKICQAFIENCLLPNNPPNFEKDTYDVEREEANIDILLQGKKHIIVIENKIQSNINGLAKSFQSQINSLFKKIDPQDKEIKPIKENLEKEAQDYLVTMSQEARPTQLSKYYAYARLLGAASGIEPNNILYCILVPNYQKYFINKNELTKSYLFGSFYAEHILYYNRVYDFFNPKSHLFDDLDEKERSYLADFDQALAKHAQEKDTYYENEIKRRFYNAIFEVKAESEKNKTK